MRALKRKQDVAIYLKMVTTQAHEGIETSGRTGKEPPGQGNNSSP